MSTPAPWWIFLKPRAPECVADMEWLESLSGWNLYLCRWRSNPAEWAVLTGGVFISPPLAHPTFHCLGVGPTQADTLCAAVESWQTEGALPGLPNPSEVAAVVIPDHPFRPPVGYPEHALLLQLEEAHGQRMVLTYQTGRHNMWSVLVDESAGLPSVVLAHGRTAADALRHALEDVEFDRELIPEMLAL